MTLRILLGVSQGFIFPCVHTLLATWVPPSERSRLGTFVYAGSPLGNVFMLAISGLLASSSLGWPSIFYASGIIGVVWTALFFTFGSNSPEVDVRITSTEREFIQEALGQETDTEEIKVILLFTLLQKKISLKPYLNCRSYRHHGEGFLHHYHSFPLSWHIVLKIGVSGRY